MRQYTLVFMEQRIGVTQLMPMEGSAGLATFAVEDDEAAIAYTANHLIERLKSCARAELSSRRIVPDPTASGGMRLVDDSLANPYFQDTFLKYNTVTKTIEVDFESTRTALLADLAVLRTTGSRTGTV